MIHMMTGKSQLKPACLLLILFIILTGFIYPFITTGLATLFFPILANGSLVLKGNNVIGSEWIGQPFTDPRYFWGRPSATTPEPYNALASSGSNLGPTNPALWDAVKTNIVLYQKNASDKHTAIPLELVSASGSGLDPHISPLAAKYQVPRIAKARKISEDLLYQLIDRKTENRQFFVLGEPRVNVLLLNIELDNRKVKNARKT